MKEKARSIFLDRLIGSGFYIVEEGDTLKLSPRDTLRPAEIIIQEKEPNKWQIIGASGTYAGFFFGKKRAFFQATLDQWVLEAVAQGEY